MTPKQILKKLEALGNEMMRKHNTKAGARDDQFGCKKGDLRKFAKELKNDHELALKLWETGNIDARFLAILMMKPKRLSAEDLDRMVREEPFTEAADWFSNHVIKKHPEAESLREGWMDSGDPMAERAGWSLTAGRVAREPEGLNLKALLDRIEREMGAAHPAPQWTMNVTLGYIGIHHEQHRKRALKIAEKLGVYKDYPTSKGCTSPYAVEWINEMVSRES